MAEKVMQDLMNDPHVSPNDRTFLALIRGCNCLTDKNWRAERNVLLVVQDARHENQTESTHS